jgi:hypothetical protein
MEVAMDLKKGLRLRLKAAHRAIEALDTINPEERASLLRAARALIRKADDIAGKPVGVRAEAERNEALLQLEIVGPENE